MMRAVSTKVGSRLEKVLTAYQEENVGAAITSTDRDLRIAKALAQYHEECAMADRVAAARNGGATHRTAAARQRAELNRIIRAPDIVRYKMATARVRIDTANLLTSLHGDGWLGDMKTGKRTCHLALYVLSKRGKRHPVNAPIRNLLLRLFAIYAADHGDNYLKRVHPPMTKNVTSPLIKWLAGLPGMPQFGDKAVLAACREYRQLQEREGKILSREYSCEVTTED